MSYIFASLSRISGLWEKDFTVQPLVRGSWQYGDYVVGQADSPPGPNSRVELTNGRMTQILRGDQVVGAFGLRHATLAAVGDWRLIEEDGAMNALTAAGLFGKCTSISPFEPPLITLTYKGHVHVDGTKVRMKDVLEPVPEREFTLPVILIIGTSMSAGKTSSARVIIRQLKKLGHTVAAAKITGAGRYRDVLSMADAGADFISDFVDSGLPSTVCSEERFQNSLIRLLSMIEGSGSDVAVLEAGASPLEPYNGATAVKLVEKNRCFTVLCASDPYAVVGVISGFQSRPDLVSGIATNTSAGIDLIEKLTGIKALNLMDESSWPRLTDSLEKALRSAWNPVGSS